MTGRGDYRTIFEAFLYSFNPRQSTVKLKSFKSELVGHVARHGFAMLNTKQVIYKPNHVLLHRLMRLLIMLLMTVMLINQVAWEFLKVNY